ncbi:hypothetical protein [Acidovorax sp. PRC11]|uniref:hypothetical protein n=1 Tax=Acidovorax sp. PRC11 TaxID=2962592 RepID=UPI002881D55C|nr:hypothetical protein [Acidovorax sp. PRC11]MDT0137741.1 hypothetical protein [Acidovorax sp. PRC11]
MTTETVVKAWLLYPGWLGYSETIELPDEPGAYSIEEDAESWVLRHNDTGAEQYRGLGPIRIVDEPIPF